jgi:uncharacterized damage-inducible protein DinB
MRKTLKVRSFEILVPGVAVALLAIWAGSSAPAGAASKTAPKAKEGAGSFQNTLLGNIEYTEKQIMSLEDAVPQAKYTWRPAAGVRSISEVYMHIAFANYGILKAANHEPPADAGWEMNIEKWDKKTTDKAEIKKVLEKSFEHAKSAIKATSDADLDKKVNLFGTELTQRALLMVLYGHMNEHLGQSIAYARSNNVAPPWSKS